MNALEYLNQVVNYQSAFVPETLASSIIRAAAALGVTIHAGLLDTENNTVVLYI